LSGLNRKRIETSADVERFMIKTPLKIILIFVPICLGIALYIYESRTPEVGFFGYVEGEFVRVASPLAGALTSLPVKRGMTISSGTPLFVLEQENEVAARDEAHLRHIRAKFSLENIKTGKRPEEIEVIEDTLTQAMADERFSALFLKRQEKLILTNATSLESLERARSAHDHDIAHIAELKAQLKVARLPGRPMELKGAEKDMEAAKALLTQAQWRVDQKSIQSPVTGFIFDTLYVQGEWIPAGSPIVVLLPPENIKVRFFVPEEELGNLKINQLVKIKIDGEQTGIPATLSYIAPVAEYTPPVIFSREWRSKLVYMVEARPNAHPEKFHPGQPVEVMTGKETS
jgi:HlyD family secretion protein